MADTYVCLGCGYFEERLPMEQLADKVEKKIRAEWESLSHCWKEDAEGLRS